MKSVNLHVTIATSAYNEEANVGAFLKSVLAQKVTNYRLDKILVISDGSEDKTAEIAKSFEGKKIEVLDLKQREGKSKHLNDIFKSLTSDILVLFDSDVVLKGQNTVENLIMPLVKKEADLVGGNPQCLPGKNIVERGVNCSFRVFDKLRVMGYWAYGCDGRILAMSRKFAKTVKIPNDMIANDAFMYFFALSHGFKFKHVRDAIVEYRSPDNIRDQIRQNIRFIAAHYRLERIFGEIVPAQYKMPEGYYIRETFKEFVKHPLDSLTLFGINLICRYKAKKNEKKLTAIWQMAESTKTLR